MLRKVGPYVEELRVVEADYQHLGVIQTMPALRKLDLECNLGSDEAVPTLPLTLEELRIENFTFEHLLSVEWMSKLRKLELVEDEDDDALEFDFTSGTGRLEQLEVDMGSFSTVLSLVRANADTLQKLDVRCSSRPGDLFWSVAKKLQRCGLVALRRLVLRRSFYRSSKDHDSRSCRTQLAALRARLGASVDVECSQCSYSYS